MQTQMHKTTGEAARHKRSGTPPMRAPLARAQRRADGLGWLSLGLGLAQLLAPRFVARVAGVKSRPDVAMRVIGAREIASGVGILTSARPGLFAWMRVAGDAVDLALLGAQMMKPRARRARIGLSLAALTGLTLIDIAIAARLGAGKKEVHRTVIKTITVNRPTEVVQSLWSLWDGNALTDTILVRFSAVRGSATEVRVEMRDVASGGALAGAIAKLVGNDSGGDVDRALRHFKQVAETGEIMHSDASIHKGRHPARPDDAKEVMQ